MTDKFETLLLWLDERPRMQIFALHAFVFCLAVLATAMGAAYWYACAMAFTAIFPAAVSAETFSFAIFPVISGFVALGLFTALRLIVEHIDRPR